MEQAEQLEYQIYRQFQIADKIGKGTYGVVYKAIQKRNKKVVAIKKIIDAFQNLIDAKRTYRQLNYLLQLEHPAIVRLEYLLPSSRKANRNKPSTTRLEPPQPQVRGCNTDKLTQHLSNQPRHVYAVFQYAETDLRLALKKCSEMQSIQRKFIGYQLLHGIAYLHRSGLVHRDIKPQNILLNCNKLEVKICDFGMARLSTALSGNQGVLTEYVASRWYRPPQALLGINTCQPTIDLWSIGCVLAELALNSPLFQGKSTLDQLECILRSIGMPTNTQIDKLQSQQSKYVLKNFSFSRKAKFRPLQDTLSMCSNAEIDLIMNLLHFDPSERISAEQALRHQFFDEVRGINPELQNFSSSKAHLTDLSDRIITNQKGQKVKLGIEDYRSYIEELQKFADRSTNRSIPINRSGGLLRQAYASMTNQNYESQKENDMNEKSTKQSNFVTEHKHQFLSKTHDSLQKVKEEGQNLNKTSKQPLKMVKNKRNSSKNVINKSRNTHSHHDLKSVKSKTKDGKDLKKNTFKNLETFNKTNKKQKQMKKSDPLKIQRQILNKKGISTDNRINKGCEGSMHSYKEASKIIDNASMISNYSKGSSIKSKSREKSKQKLNSPLKILQISHKEQLIKNMMKKPLNLNKPGLTKCKSSNHVNHFKK